MPSPMYEVLPQNQRVRHHPYIRLSKSKTGADEDIETQAVRRQILTSNAGKYGGRRDPNRSDVAPKVINTDYMEKKSRPGAPGDGLSVRRYSFLVLFWKALLVLHITQSLHASVRHLSHFHANAVGPQCSVLTYAHGRHEFDASPCSHIRSALLLTGPENSAEENTGVQVQGNGRKFMLLGGFGMMILADLLLVMAKAPWQVFIGYLAVGAHMSMTQANMKAVFVSNLCHQVCEEQVFAISALTQGIATWCWGTTWLVDFVTFLVRQGAFWGRGGRLRRQRLDWAGCFYDYQHSHNVIYTFDVTGRSMRFDLQTISSSLSASNPFDLYVLTKVPQ